MRRGLSLAYGPSIYSSSPPNETKTRLYRKEQYQHDALSIISSHLNSTPGLANLHIITIALLKPIDLPMTHVVVFVRQASLAQADVPPPFAAVFFAAVEVQGQGQGDLDAVVDVDGVELGVDVEGQRRLLVVADRGQAGDALVFGAVDAGDGEGVFE